MDSGDDVEYVFQFFYYYVTIQLVIIKIIIFRPLWKKVYVFGNVSNCKQLHTEKTRMKSCGKAPFFLYLS